MAIQGNGQYNSFANNMQKVLKAQVNSLSLLHAIQESVSTDNKYVNCKYEDNDGMSHEFTLPSYTTIVNDVKALQDMYNKLCTGQGAITVNGDTRVLKLHTVPQTPANISGLESPTTFGIDSNWFFESFMFPGAVVHIDLSGRVASNVQKVHVCRVIVSNQQSSAQNAWKTSLSGTDYSYTELISLLQDANITYSEDIETVQLPWVHNKYSGQFRIIDDPIRIDNSIWYYLDTLNYRTISEEGLDHGNNNVLAIGDQLTYNNSLFSITGIDINDKRITMRCISGAAFPGADSTMEFYKDPSSEKYVNVRFGAHEYNFVFFKAISPDYGIMSTEWSNAVKFDSDSLLYANDVKTNFVNFYNENISDWGAKLIAEAKERWITAYQGTTPNAPVLSASDFEVKQINLHLNTNLNVSELQQNMAQLAKMKNEMENTTTTLNQTKSELYLTKTVDTYNSKVTQISQYTSELGSIRQSYVTQLEQMRTLYLNSDNIKMTPKYRIRGFFPMPVPVYIDAYKQREQQTIGFIISYRYLSKNKQSQALQTFKYINEDKQQNTGVYTDWVEVKSKTKERVLDEETGLYVWKAENPSDGTLININQVDIPISAGECVEIRVKSISEAGYPSNPLMSDWSNSVTVEFPTGGIQLNETQLLLDTLNTTLSESQITNTLQNNGVFVHTDDNIETFKHQAKYIAYEDVQSTSVSTISLQDKIAKLESMLVNLQTKYDALLEKAEENKATATEEDTSAGNNTLISTKGSISFDDVSTAKININGKQWMMSELASLAVRDEITTQKLAQNALYNAGAAQYVQTVSSSPLKVTNTSTNE